ncbi:hypothetical protein CapIbe_001115 [Capra ibex]
MVAQGSSAGGRGAAPGIYCQIQTSPEFGNLCVRRRPRRPGSSCTATRRLHLRARLKPAAPERPCLARVRIRRATVRPSGPPGKLRPTVAPATGRSYCIQPLGENRLAGKFWFEMPAVFYSEF